MPDKPEDAFERVQRVLRGDVEQELKNLETIPPMRYMPVPTARNAEEIQAKYNANEMRALHREQGKNLVGVIVARVQQLQAGLKEGEELVVYCDAGRDTLVVQSFEFPTWNLAIAVGLDENENQTHRIENVQDVKLTCKVMKSANAKRRPIGFTLPSDQ